MRLVARAKFEVRRPSETAALSVEPFPPGHHRPNQIFAVAETFDHGRRRMDQDQGEQAICSNCVGALDPANAPICVCRLHPACSDNGCEETTMRETIIAAATGL